MLRLSDVKKQNTMIRILFILVFLANVVLAVVSLVALPPKVAICFGCDGVVAKNCLAFRVPKD